MRWMNDGKSEVGAEEADEMNDQQYRKSTLGNFEIFFPHTGRGARLGAKNRKSTAWGIDMISSSIYY